MENAIIDYITSQGKPKLSSKLKARNHMLYFSFVDTHCAYTGLEISTRETIICYFPNVPQN